LFKENIFNYNYVIKARLILVVPNRSSNWFR